MPSDEPKTRAAERCSRHPTRSAIERCEGCGRPLCLSCALPVRGLVFGAECLPEAPSTDPGGRAEGRQPLTLERLAVGAAFALALVATAVPWTRFGVGSGVFGAWASSPRWASLAAVAAALGFVTWMVQLMRPRGVVGLDLAHAVLGGLVAAGALLAITRPPAFTRTWIGPWIALASGLVAMTASILSYRRARTTPAPPS